VAEQPPHGRFATTRWSIVLAAGGASGSESSRDALAELCETYWYPLYAFLRTRGHSAEDAEDLTQAFFARLIEKRAVERADPSRGRFRSFLLTSLKHFSANEYHRGAAQKRGAGVPILSLEFERAEGRFQLEPASAETPESSFDRRWALALLERVLVRLEQEMLRSGKGPQYGRLKSYLTRDEPQTSYADAARDLDTSEGALKVAVHRLRRRFRDLVLDEIAQTVSSADEVDDELRHLWAAVGR
jgi:RNA polymerase sigma factor (sigma-70 family)